MFKDRNSNTMTLELFGTKKVYNLLLKLEFTSDRKKMTVVVEDPDTGIITLYTKGADFAIFEKLSVKIE
jgi:magnesium-transporting ATPase (P-type)